MEGCSTHVFHRSITFGFGLTAIELKMLGQVYPPYQSFVILISIFLGYSLSLHKLFQVPKTHLGMGHIRGLRGEEMPTCGLIMYFYRNLGKRPSFG